MCDVDRKSLAGLAEYADDDLSNEVLDNKKHFMKNIAQEK